MLSFTLAPQEHRPIKYGLLTGFLLSILLVIITLFRYPGNAFTAIQYRELVAVALLILISLACWIFWRGTQTTSVNAPIALQQGARIGLVCGFFWILEISFNNFIPPAISTDTARFYVDNGLWAVIALVIITSSANNAFQCRNLIVGIQTGFWSGLVSGLLACLMGLLLIIIWMNFLLRDPSTIAEFAVRGAASAAPNIATYVAYETMPGALGHLTVLGIVMGLILGVIGGVIGKGFATLVQRIRTAQKVS